jgi:hypothetical protein
VFPGHFSSLDEADETGRFAASLDDLKKRKDVQPSTQRDLLSLEDRWQYENHVPPVDKTKRQPCPYTKISSA